MADTHFSGPVDSKGGFKANGVPIANVTQQPAIANQAALTVTGADATAVAASAQTAVQTLGTKINSMLAALRAAGIILP